MTRLIHCGMGNKGMASYQNANPNEFIQGCFHTMFHMFVFHLIAPLFIDIQLSKRKLGSLELGGGSEEGQLTKAKDYSTYIWTSLKGGSKGVATCFLILTKNKHATYSTFTHTQKHSFSFHFFFLIFSFFFNDFSLFSCQGPHPLFALLSLFLSTSSFAPCGTLPNTTSSPSKPSMQAPSVP